MLFRWIMRLLTFNPVSIILGRFLGMAHEIAQINQEEDSDALTQVWYVFVMIASCGIGFWAARWYMHSMPAGDFGMGGMVFVLIDIIIFFVGFGVGATFMTKLALAMKNRGRPIMAVVVSIFLFFALYWPMHKDSLAESQKQEESRRAVQMAATENVNKEAEKLPFVVPVAVPEMLEITREGDAYRIQNRSGGELSVSFALVLFHDKLLDRCWARVELGECTADSTICALPASSSVPSVPDAGATTIDTHPVLAAGEAKVFAISHCDPRFADGMLEYYVWNNAEQRFLFRSETTLIPDYH